MRMNLDPDVAERPEELLVFVRNQNGSRTPAEAMRMGDVASATGVIRRWLMDRGDHRPRLS